MTFSVRYIPSLSLLLLATAGQAQVVGYDAFRTQYFNQTSSAAPVTPQSYQFYSRIFLTHQTDANTGTLTAPDASQYTMPQYLLDPILNTYYLYHGEAFSTQAAEDAKYGTGTYTFSLIGGTYAGSSANLTMPANDFATTVPYLTGSSYNALQGMDASQSISLTWNSFTDLFGNNSFNTTYFVIQDGLTGAYLYASNGPGNSYTGASINAGLLLPGHQYTYSLFYSSRYDGPPNTSGNGFNGSRGLSAFDYATSGTFTTAAPEPSALACLIGLPVLFLRKRKVSVN